jgi:hypothetical protein
MSGAKVTVRYDGPILADHRMDVADLAPALIGISDLIKLANQRFNGDSTAVRVLIDTDVEHQCFQIDLHIVQAWWDQAKAFLGNENVASAKELLEWLGLLSGGSLGLFGALKWLKGRKVTSSQLIVQDGKNVVQLRIEGDNNVVTVFSETYQLLLDDSALASAKKVVLPVAQEGYETLEFESGGDEIAISKDEASAIAATNAEDIKAPTTDDPQTLTAWITVYAPVYDAKAPKWRFKFGNSVEYMDITETEIASQAIARGGAMMDDAYRVHLELRQQHLPGGDIRNSYKIKEVLDFKAARLPHQLDVFSAKKNGPENIE